MGVQRLIGIYNADGSLMGELAYIVGKALGRAHCTLCDITHSPVRRKPAWNALVASLPIPLDVVHRDERSVEVAALTSGKEPCIVAQDDDASLSILISDSELAACDGSVNRFSALLMTKLALSDKTSASG